MLQHDAEDMNRDMGSLMRSLQHAILEKTTTGDGERDVNYVHDNCSFVCWHRQGTHM